MAKITHTCCKLLIYEQKHYNNVLRLFLTTFWSIWGDQILNNDIDSITGILDEPISPKLPKNQNWT